MNIGDRKIGSGEKCFIMVDIGVNHILEPEDLQKTGLNSPLEVAFKLVDAAKEAGVDAVKFQSFKAEKLQLKGTKKPEYQNKAVGTDEEVNYFNLIKNLETSEEDQVKIANYCKENNIMFLSTPYDNDSVDFLDETIKVPAFKLASIELKNHLFFRYLAKKNKPIILSTGLGDLDDVKEIIRIAKEENITDKLILLQCTSNYPTPAEEINLNVLKTYLKEFPEITFGLSDHSPTEIPSLGAIAIGANLVEKHFTLDKNFKGPDHAASLNPEEVRSWVSNIREMEESMGSYKKEVTNIEKGNYSMKKFLVIKPQPAGSLITEDSLETMRTGEGIEPVDNNLKDIIGKKLKGEIKELTPLTREMIE